MSQNPPIYAKTIDIILLTISFVVYIFILIVLILTKEHLTLYKFFQIQTLPFSIIYSLSNINYFGSSTEVSFFCKFLTNIRSISFILIISIQTLIILFIFLSLKYTSYIEQNISKIYTLLYLIPHLSWIIMVLLSLTNRSYSKSVDTGLCKYKNDFVTYYRMILYIINAIVCLVFFIWTIRVIKKTDMKANVISIYVKSFLSYFICMFVYLLSYLCITVLMVLEMESGLEAGFDTPVEKGIWVLRVFSQNAAPVIASCLNCLTKVKINLFLKKICKNKFIVIGDYEKSMTNIEKHQFMKVLIENDVNEDSFSEDYENEALNY